MPEITQSALEAMISEGSTRAATEVVAPLIASVEALTKSIQAMQQPNPQTEPQQRQYVPQLFGGDGSQPAPLPDAHKDLPKGLGAARSLKAMALANGDPEKAKSIVSKMYPDDNRLIQAFGDTKSLTSTVAEDGGFLIPAHFMPELITLLHDASVMQQLPITTIPISNNLSMPVLVEGSTAQYIGETEDTKQTGIKFAQKNWSSKQLGAFVPISKRLLQQNSIQADVWVRNELVQAISAAMDNSFLYGKGTQHTPKGITNYGIKTVSYGKAIESDDLTIFLADLMSAMKNNALNSLAWLFHTQMWARLYNLTDQAGRYIFRDEMGRGLLLGIPFVHTNKVNYDPVGAHNPTEIILGNWSDFIMAEEEQYVFTASDQASYPSGNQMLSCMTRNETLINVLAMHDYNIKREEAFVRVADIWTT